MRFACSWVRILPLRGSPAVQPKGRERDKNAGPHWASSPICPSEEIPLWQAVSARHIIGFMTTTASLPIAEIESQILSPEARTFLIDLARKFELRRQELLAKRRVRQQEIEAGKTPDFLPETAEIR